MSLFKLVCFCSLNKIDGNRETTGIDKIYYVQPSSSFTFTRMVDKICRQYISVPGIFYLSTEETILKLEKFVYKFFFSLYCSGNYPCHVNVRLMQNDLVFY